MVKLVAVDTDGTLLGPGGHISVCNAHVTWRMQNVDVELLVYTDRGYADTPLSLEEARLEAAVVCMNEASVYDWKGRLIHKQELVQSQVERILECRRNEDVTFDFMTDRGNCTIAGEGEFRECFRRDILLPMAEYSYENIRRRSALIPPSELFCGGLELYRTSVIYEPRQALEQVKERPKAVEDPAVASSFITNLELTHTEAQKGKTLAVYVPMKNIRLDQIVAIGDGESDYSMLFMNPKYTVAMGNAMERIKNTARRQTHTNAQDGVTYAIENLVLYKEVGRARRSMSKIDPMH